MLEPDPAIDSLTQATTPDATPAISAGPDRRAGTDRRAANGARQLWMDQTTTDLELERMHHGVPIQCQFCVGQNFRRSRLRSADIGQLLLMRYPVRCTRCSQRQNVSFTIAGIAIPSYIRQRERGGRAPEGSSSRRHHAERAAALSTPSPPDDPANPRS